MATRSKTAAKTPAAKTPAKPAAKKAAKPAAKKVAKKVLPPAPKAAPAPVPAAAPAPAPRAQAAAKSPKPKLVRDSFTFPKTEYAQLDALKQRAVALKRPAKKSELIRAGIKALAAMGDAALLAALAAVPPIKTGRPKAEKH